MDKIVEYFKNCQVVYLASIAGDQACVRPFATPFLVDNKLIWATDVSKEVYKQLHANGKCEICAMAGGGSWIRLNGIMEICKSEELKKNVLAAVPGSEQAAANPNFAIVYLEHGTATISSFGAAPETVTF